MPMWQHTLCQSPALEQGLCQPKGSCVCSREVASASTALQVPLLGSLLQLTPPPKPAPQPQPG